MPAPSSLPAWATSTGSTVVGSLVPTAAQYQGNYTAGPATFGVIRYTFSAADLSAVLPGHFLTVAGFTNADNNGTLVVKEANDTDNWIDVLSTLRYSTSLDETGITGTGSVADDGAVSQEPSVARKGQGHLSPQKPVDAHENWWKKLVYDWLAWFEVAVAQAGVKFAATFTALRAVATTDFGDSLYQYFVTDFGVYNWVPDSELPDDDEIVIIPDDVDPADPGRWILSLPHPDLIYTYTEEQTGAIGDLVNTISQVSTINPASVSANTTNDETVTVTGAAVGDEVHVTPPATLDTGLSVTGFVSATDTVKVRFANCTGGPINPGSADYRITVRQYQA